MIIYCHIIEKIVIKMTQHVKGLVAKSNDLSLIPEYCIIEGENQPPVL